MNVSSAPASVVLVHGGFVDGSGWRAVYDLLTQDGYHVAVVQNPTLSLEGDAAAELAFMTISFPPELVQHCPVTGLRAWTNGHSFRTVAHLPAAVRLFAPASGWARFAPGRSWTDPEASIHHGPGASPKGSCRSLTPIAGRHAMKVQHQADSRAPRTARLAINPLSGPTRTQAQRVSPPRASAPPSYSCARSSKPRRVSPGHA